MQLPERTDVPGKKGHAAGFAAADGNFAGQFLRAAEFLSGFVGQFHDFLGAALEKPPGVGKGDPVLAAQKQLGSQLLLQLHQLPGKGGLGDMQQRRRLCDVFLLRHREKIAQHSQFHTIPSCKLL